MKQIMEVRDLVKTFPAFKLGPINWPFRRALLSALSAKTGPVKARRLSVCWVCRSLTGERLKYLISH